MKTDLIERLRVVARNIVHVRSDASEPRVSDILTEAADRIAALEAGGWQPIGTAPKDRRILLGRFTGDRKDEHDTYCAVDRWRYPTPGYGYTGWGQFNATHWPPTHWREVGRPS